MNNMLFTNTHKNPYNYLWSGLTDLQLKIDELLREIKDQVPNAICFALTDQLLTYYTKTIYTPNAEDIVVDEDNHIRISIRDNPNISTQDGDHTAILVKIDPENQRFEFTVSLMIFFYKGNDHFASCSVQFSMKGMPNINMEFLEFAITDIKLMTPQTRETIYVINQTIIDEVYNNIDGFVSYVNSLLEKFREEKSPDATSEVNGIIPALINIINLPDDWRFLQGAVLHSPQFFYKNVRLMGATNGCLFVVFTVQSTNKPFPCNCDDFADFTNLSQLNNSRRHVAIGISQDALFEIMKPLVDNALNISYIDSTGNGEIHAEVSYWIKGYLTDLKLLKDGIDCKFNQTEAGGYIAAAVRVLKRDIWKRKYGVKIQLDNTVIDFKRFQLITSNKDSDIKISTQPEVIIENINVEFSPPTQELEWLIEIIVNTHKDKLNKIIQSSLKLTSFKKPRQRFINGIMETEFAYAEFFENSSMILTMQVRWNG